MTDAERIAALEAALEDVRAQLNPQTLRQALERTFDPRGGEPRVIDSAGNTLDYVPAIQFVGATAELDVPAQRVVVTAASNPGLEAWFNDDGTPDDTERLRFKDHTTPTVNHHVLNTRTSGSTRSTLEQTAETCDTATTRTVTPSANQEHAVNAAGFTARHSLSAYGSAATAPNGFADVQLDVQTVHTAKLRADANGGVAEFNAAIDTTFGLAASTATVRAGDTAAVAPSVVVDKNGSQARCPSAPQTFRQIYQQDSTSHYMQAEYLVGQGANPPRTMRLVVRGGGAQTANGSGAITGAVTALAAGASTSFTLANVRVGTDYVLAGGFDGAAGSELLLWSWTSSGTNDVLVNVTNSSLLAALTATFRCVVISTS